MNRPVIHSRKKAVALTTLAEVETALRSVETTIRHIALMDSKQVAMNFVYGFMCCLKYEKKLDNIAINPGGASLKVFFMIGETNHMLTVNL